MKNIFERLFSLNHKCLILLILFLLWLMAGPSLIETRFGNIYLAICVIFLAIGPYIITRDKRLFMSSLILASIAFTIKLLAHNADVPSLMPFFCTILLFFDFTMILSVIYYTTVSGRYTRDSIFGSIFTYMMIGVCFADTYYMLQYLDLIKFTVGNNHGVIIHLEDCFYFSFTSLTTMGYGDILPDTPLTKRLSYVEAAAGTMYTAVFIGRLIATYGSHKTNEK